MYNHIPNARAVGKVAGRQAHRFTVLAILANSRLLTETEVSYSVIAHTADEAVNLIRDLYEERPETTILTFGPKGGRTERYIGWDTAIGNMLWSSRDTQLNLNLKG